MAGRSRLEVALFGSTARMREEGRIMNARSIKRTLAALVIVVALLVSGGCGSEQGSGTASAARTVTFPVTVTDDAGRKVTIDAKPERIVSLAPGNTEICFALGILDRVVGVTTYDDFPPEVTSIEKVGDFVTPNLEAIAALEPDLVLATTGVQADLIDRIEATGARVVAIDPASLDALYDSIMLVGTITGEPAAAASLVDRMKADLETIQSAIEAAPVPCFIEIAQEPLFTAGQGTLINDLIEQAGGENIVTEQGYVAYSLETLLTKDPEVYLATRGSMSDPNDLAKRPGFDKLAAVKNGRVHVLDDNLVSRPGPRVIDGIRQIAESLHPEAFGK